MTDERYKEIEQLMKAGDLGRQAYKTSATRRDNPFYLATKLHEQWDESFCQALYEDIPNICKR